MKEFIKALLTKAPEAFTRGSMEFAGLLLAEYKKSSIDPAQTPSTIGKWT